MWAISAIFSSLQAITKVAKTLLFPYKLFGILYQAQIFTDNLKLMCPFDIQRVYLTSFIRELKTWESNAATTITSCPHLSSEETPCQPGAEARDLPLLLSYEKRRKIDLKEIPSCLIPWLLVVFTRKLEILVTAQALVL